MPNKPQFYLVLSNLSFSSLCTSTVTEVSASENELFCRLSAVGNISPSHAYRTVSIATRPYEVIPFCSRANSGQWGLKGFWAKGLVSMRNDLMTFLLNRLDSHWARIYQPKRSLIFQLNRDFRTCLHLDFVFVTFWECMLLYVQSLPELLCKKKNVFYVGECISWCVSICVSWKEYVQEGASFGS